MFNKSLIVLCMTICLFISPRIIMAETHPSSLPTQKRTVLSQIPKGYQIIPASIKLSPDMQHVTYAAYSDTAHNVVCLDNKTSATYYSIQAGTPIFSPKANRHAYIAYKTKTDAIVVVDGQASEVIDRVDNLQFSPDGSRYAFRAQKGKIYFVVVDGKPGPQYEGIPVKNNMKFSPDSKHFAYVKFQDKKSTLILDGKEEGKPFGFIIDVIFSSDSNHYTAKALITKHGNKEEWCVIRDGNAEAVYDKIFDLVFSYDSRHLTYAAVKARQMVLVMDGKEIAQEQIVGMPTFSYDSQNFYYGFSKNNSWHINVNGDNGPGFDQIGKFYGSFDSKKCAYFAKEGDDWLCVVDNKKGPKFQKGVDIFKFSFDSSRYAYAGIGNNGTQMIIDGVPGKLYPSVGEPYFSFDSKRIVFKALKDDQKNWITVLDGKESFNSYYGIDKYEFSSDSKHMAFPALIGLNNSVMVVDGKEQLADRDLIIVTDPFFSPDGNHIVYTVMASKDTWFLNVNGSILPEPFGGSQKGTPIIFDSPNHFHTIGLNKTGDQFLLIDCDIPETFKLKSRLQ